MWTILLNPRQGVLTGLLRRLFFSADAEGWVEFTLCRSLPPRPTAGVVIQELVDIAIKSICRCCPGRHPQQEAAANTCDEFEVDLSGLPTRAPTPAEFFPTTMCAPQRRQRHHPHPLARLSCMPCCCPHHAGAHPPRPTVAT